MSSALRKTFLVGLGAAAIAGLPLSQAASQGVGPTSITTFGVTATVVTTCSVTATELAFGNYTGVLLAGTGTVNATCSNLTPYTIGLDAGTGTGATTTIRKMKPTAGTGLLNYSLFQDSAHTINWGNTGTGTPDVVVGVGSGAVQPHTVFGQIPAGQFVQGGQYSDTITVTLTF